jgi:DNA-binding MarR family transcriptional regulator
MPKATLGSAFDAFAGALADEVAFATLDATRRPLRLDPGAYAILVAIVSSPAREAKALGRTTKLPPAKLRPALRALVRAGLVHPDDRSFAATPRGYALIRSTRGAVGALSRRSELGMREARDALEQLLRSFE